MSSDDLRKAMSKLSNGLKDSFEASGAIKHALTLGEVRESEVIDALRPHLSTRYHLAKGEVINTAGERSQQQDIIISDALTGTPFLASGGIGVFPVEIVSATLQVKSQVAPSTIGDDVHNVASAKRLANGESRVRTKLMSKPGGNVTLSDTDLKPFGGIIAFNSTQSLEDIANAYLDANLELPAADRCDGLVILNKATFAWIDQQAKRARFAAKGTDGLAIFETTDALLHFYLLLQGALANYEPPIFEPQDYDPDLFAVNTRVLTWEEQ